MIYLIDDKKERQQKDYKFDDVKLSEYKGILTPIYLYKEIEKATVKEKVFSKGNVILFHESFFDNPRNKHPKESEEIRKNLTQYAKEGKYWLAIFSGSKSTRYLDNQIAHLPVSVLYENLDVFVQKAKEGEVDLKYLLYGAQNSNIEQVLFEKLSDANDNFDISELHSEKLAFLAVNDDRQNIPLQLTNSISEEIFIDEEFKKKPFDIFLNHITNSWFANQEFERIFIPLCFGPSLSDYNGLKLAIHIRCTQTPNQLKPIFIYSFVGYEHILKNEFFGILKSKNIFLIDYKREAFKAALEVHYSSLTKDELPKEIAKLKLDPPKNYYDNHSIANEWGIFQMARNANIEIDEIEGFDAEILKSLFFKWLVTKNSLHEPIPLEQKEEQKRYAEKLPGLKVKGKIDL